MAFPVVESVTVTLFSSDTTSHALNFESTSVSGELLILVFANDGLTVQTTPAGWTALDKKTQGNQVYGGIYAKLADGTEGGTTVDVVTASAEAGTGHIYRISTWGGDLATHVDISTVVQGTSNAPNPSTGTAGWGSEDNLFLAIICAGDDDETVSVFPTSYTNPIDGACGAGANNSGRASSARRLLAAASDDPSAFSLNGSENWLAWTVVVAPVLSGTTVVDLFEVTWLLDPSWDAYLTPQTNEGSLIAGIGQFAISWAGTNVDPLPIVIGTPIINENATFVESNFEICDRTGFKQYPWGLQVQWDGVAVRKKSFEARHPQEILRHRGTDRQRGSKNPEPEDVFVGTVSVDDL